MTGHWSPNQGRPSVLALLLVSVTLLGESKGSLSEQGWSSSSLKSDFLRVGIGDGLHALREEKVHETRVPPNPIQFTSASVIQEHQCFLNGLDACTRGLGRLTQNAPKTANRI